MTKQKKIGIIVFISLLFFILLLFLIMRILVNKTDIKYNIDDIKNDFSQYNIDKNVVILSHNQLVFDNYIVDFNNINLDEDVVNIEVCKNKIIFVTVVKDKKHYNMHIYECDLHGENIKLIMSNKNLITNPNFYSINNIMYIQHYTNKGLFNDDSRVIDAFDLSSYEYKNVSMGEAIELSDYKKNKLYNINYSNDKIEINVKKTNKDIVIDNDILNNTIYYENLKEYDFKLDKAFEYNGHIYVSFVSFIGYYGSFKYQYACSIFELNFETKELEYKTILYADLDTESYQILNTNL